LVLNIESKLLEAPVVPLIQASDPAIAIQTAQALVDGGLAVVEVVLRTPEAVQCLAAIVDSVPGAVTGAGTVLDVNQAQSAVSAGAQFIVSPGLDEGVVNIANENGIRAYPGVSTATEVQRAYNMGLRTVKFFPASLAGGPPMLNSLAAVFRDMSFMPTGGVSASNLADYLTLPAVIACGGSWLTPQAAIAERSFDTVTTLAKQAIAIAASARGPA